MSDRSFLSWPFFEPRHREYSLALDAWATAAELPHNVREDNVDAVCRRLVADLAEGGWLRAAVADGDGPLDVRTLCLTREILARHAGIADFAFAMQGLGAGPISLFGTSAQREHYLPAVAAGAKIAAFALSEPDAGSNAAALSTTARADGDTYVINGVKTWISNGGIADFYVVFARTNDTPGAKGVSAIIVDAETPGLTVAERIPLIAPHPLARLEFKNVRAPRSALIGAEGAGFKVAMSTLDVFRSTVGAAALGLARRAFDETLARVATRHLAGAPLAALQMTQASLADMALAIDTSALLVYRAAWTKDVVGSRVTREAAMAKLYATEAAQEVIDRAVQLFGALGVVSGHPVETLYREVRALRIYEGATEVQKIIIARQALDQAQQP